MGGYIGTKAVTLSTTTASVGGDSTVGGDLTVDTNTLYVDSANNRVGIGTTSPASTASAGPTLEISGTAGGNLVLSDSNATTGQRAKYFLSQGGTLYIGHSADNGTSPVNDLVVGSSGNVGIGTTSPTDTGGFGVALDVSSSTGAAVYVRDAGGSKTGHFGQFNEQTSIVSRQDDGNIGFYIGASPTERMRIDSSGNLLVGTTGYLVAGARVRASSIAATFEGEVTHAGGSGAVFWANRTSSDGWVAAWYRGGSSVGSISVTSSSTSYNTSSDHRLKENVTDVTDGITRVKQLEPKRFNFIADPDRTVDGFLAHEAQAVVPEAITGTHNEVDDDGNPVYQGIDQAKLVPLLTAALKESIAKIEALEARVTALEGN